jgi:hypothetical protein
MQPSVSGVAQSWFTIKEKLNPAEITETGLSAGAAMQIEEFNRVLKFPNRLPVPDAPGR